MIWEQPLSVNLPPSVFQCTAGQREREDQSREQKSIVLRAELMTWMQRGPLPVWTTVMTGDMREDQQAFQVLKGELLQLLAVGNCTIFEFQLCCIPSFTFRGQRVHSYLRELLSLPLEISYTIVISPLKPQLKLSYP